MPLRWRGLLLLTASCCAGAALGARPASAWLDAEIRRILAQPEYQQPDPTFLMRLLEKLSEWLRNLGWGDRVHDLKQAAPFLFWAIVGLLVAVLLLLLYHIVMTIRIALQREEPEPRRRALRAEGVAAPSVLREQALALAAGGQFAAAIELLYRALFVLLDRREMLRCDPALTNWERARALSGQPALVPELEALARRLDGLWYGGQSADAALWRHCLESVDRAWAVAEAAE